MCPEMLVVLFSPSAVRAVCTESLVVSPSVVHFLAASLLQAVAVLPLAMFSFPHLRLCSVWHFHCLILVFKRVRCTILESDGCFPVVLQLFCWDWTLCSRRCEECLSVLPVYSYRFTLCIELPVISCKTCVCRTLWCQCCGRCYHVDLSLVRVVYL